MHVEQLPSVGEVVSTLEAQRQRLSDAGVLPPPTRPPIGILHYFGVRVDQTVDEYVADAFRHPVFDLLVGVRNPDSHSDSPGTVDRCGSPLPRRPSPCPSSSSAVVNKAKTTEARTSKILVLRHQLRVLRRTSGRPKLHVIDRVLLAAASRVIPRER
jgi:hypothetical protein